MTAPTMYQGFPNTQEIVSGEPDNMVRRPEQQADGTDVATPAPSIGKGFWLEAEPKKVARDISKKWEAQDKGMAARLARWKVAVKRRDGDPYTKLIKTTDEDTYRVYTPKGIEHAPPSLNKTDDLCIKVVSNLLVDPPKPECEPSSDADDDRSSAEFSTRILMNESTESGFNIPDHVRVAEDLACAHSSGFVYAYIDPQGGGHRPREIMAPQDATTVGPDGQPVMEGPPDPLTGQPTPIVGPSIIRYVGLDGTSIVDDPNQAELEWLPKVCGEDLTGRNVRFLPDTCTGIRDADGVLIAALPTLGSLKAEFPDVAAMSADDLRKLVGYRPAIAKELMPKFAGDGQGTKTEDWTPENGPPDDALVLTLTAYHRGTLNYPMGAYVVTGGETLVLHRQEWKEQVPTRTGKMVDRAADIPIAQFRQFRDTKAQDPYGRGMVDLVSDGDPLRSFAIGAVVEYLHRINNPHLFVPVGSGIQAKSMNLPRGTPIPFNAAGGGLPKQEDIAPLPSTFMEFYHEIGAEMDSRSGLEEAAQGVASASVHSGVHAQQIIEQALVALSGVKSEMESGYMRLCRIILQLIRMGYTKPQRIKITGDSGSFKEKEWTRTDLGSTIDVKITAGTSTMLAPSAKSSIALEKFKNQAITLEQYQRAEEGNVRVLIGEQDAPAKTRIRGQISDWNDGPPENWSPPPPQVDPSTGQPAINPQTGQPAPPPTDPANPFADRRAVDTEPATALIRHNELARSQSGTKYASKPAEWKKYNDDEYQAMRKAAGVQTVQEQQAGQQAQPGTPEANWQKVVQIVTQDAITKLEQIAAQMVEAQTGLVAPAPVPSNVTHPAPGAPPAAPPKPTPATNGRPGAPPTAIASTAQSQDRLDHQRAVVPANTAPRLQPKP